MNRPANYVYCYVIKRHDCVFRKNKEDAEQFCKFLNARFKESGPFEVVEVLVAIDKMERKLIDQETEE